MNTENAVALIMALQEIEAKQNRLGCAVGLLYLIAIAIGIAWWVLK